VNGLIGGVGVAAKVGGEAVFLGIAMNVADQMDEVIV